MRTKCTLICAILALVCLLDAKSGTDLTGTWTGEVKGQDGRTGTVRFVLRQSGGQITGTAGPVEQQNPGHIYDAKLEGDHLTFAADDTDGDTGLTLTYHFDITVTQDQMRGQAHGRSGDRSWTLDLSMTRDK